MKTLGLFVAALAMVASAAANAKEGWHRANVAWVLADEFGAISFALTPKPNDNGFSCGGGGARVEFDRQRDAMVEQLSEALSVGAQVSVYLKDRGAASSGGSICIATSVQRHAVQPINNPDDSNQDNNSPRDDKVYGAILTASRGEGRLPYIYLFGHLPTREAARERGFSYCSEVGVQCEVELQFESGHCVAVSVNPGGATANPLQVKSSYGEADYQRPNPSDESWHRARSTARTYALAGCTGSRCRLHKWPGSWTGTSESDENQSYCLKYPEGNWPPVGVAVVDPLE